MFVTSLNIKLKDFGNVLVDFKKIVFICLLIYFAIPLLGLFFGKIIYTDPQLIAGQVLITVIPVGVSALIWVGISGGNSVFGVTIVIASTFLSGVTIPGLMKILVGQYIDFDANSLIIGLLLTIVLPVILGTFISELRIIIQTEQYRSLYSLIMKLSTLLILMLSVSDINLFQNRIGNYLQIIILGVFLQIISIYIFVFVISIKLLGYGIHDALDMCYISAIKNNGVGIAVSSIYFGPLVSLPVIVAIMFQQPLASIVYKLFQKKYCKK
jgi:BASS family bile acid:Na+ symporter